MANAHNFSSGNFEKKKRKKDKWAWLRSQWAWMPIARKTKLGIDINIIFKFHPNRITSHEVVLWTDRQTYIHTYRHTDITNIVVTLAGAREPKTTLHWRRFREIYININLYKQLPIAM